MSTGAAATNGTAANDHVPINAAQGHPLQQRKPYDYGGNPLAKTDTNASFLPAFGGDFQPGLYKAQKDRKIANPAPLGLSAFALTTFLLSLINMGARGTSHPNIVIAAAFGYGGLVQLLAGMWEMAIGNTFGATALSSYGGFWIAFGIIFTPGGFEVEAAYTNTQEFYDVFGFFLMGWFIFTFLLLIATFRSTVAFFLLFFFLDMAFMLLSITYLHRPGGEPDIGIMRAGGAFACLSAFAAWYNALAGILDRGNSFFLIPVAHFPWSEKGRERRGKVDNSEARASQDADKSV